MIIRLGYACLSKTIDITTSRTISYTNYLKLDEEEQINKLNELTRSNLESLDKVIDYNIKNNIHFFRLSSALVPLATLKDVDFDYITPYLDIYEKISLKIKNNNMRIDFHPDQFTVLNSTKSDVVKNSIYSLDYHHSILKCLKIENPIIILHVGSSVLGKTNSIKRFINTFNKLPEYLKSSIAIENDDKTYNVLDVLNLCKEINVPMVLDYHHYICNKGDIDINDYYKEIFSTWNIRPKIHFSSPKNKTKKEMRNHHDYINSDDFISFIESIKQINTDIDIMIEAKAKDEAIFKLVRELKFKTNYKFIDETTFEV